MRKKILFISFLVIGIVLLAILLIPQNQPVNDSNAVVAKLDENTINFLCLEMGNCYPKIFLGDYMAQVPSPIILDKVIALNNTSVYVVLYDYMYKGHIFYVNRESKDVRYINLEEDITHNLSTIVSDKLILGNNRGTLFIILKDEILDRLQLKLPIQQSSINQLFPDEKGKILITNEIPIEIDAHSYVEVFIVDVNSGQIVRNLFEIPDFYHLKERETPKVGMKFAPYITNISSDLKRVYYNYATVNNDGNPEVLFEAYDLENHQVIASSKSLTCGFPMRGYQQYRDLLFTSQYDSEGYETAMIVDLNTLTHLIELQPIVINELSDKIIVSPFGNNFLLGTNSRILIISLDGVIKKEYRLPDEWIGQNYLLVGHEN